MSAHGCLSSRVFDRSTGLLEGHDPRTGKPIVAVLCRTVQIDARVPNETSIHNGDIAYVKEVTGGKSAFVVVELALNLLTSAVRIVDVNGDQLSLVELNYQTLTPLNKIYPAYLGVVPDVGRVESSAQVFDGPKRVRISSALIGRVAKIYGYKAPQSKVVDIFRMELVRAK